MSVSAASLGVAETFNAASYFIDRNVVEGRGGSVAIECGDDCTTYDALREQVNRFGSSLRHRLGVRREERVLLLLLDGPEFAVAFFAAIKIGAVPVPLNTLWRPQDYEFVVRDSGARTIIVSAELQSKIQAMSAHARKRLAHIVATGAQ